MNDWRIPEELREQGISYREISTRCGIPYDTVQKHFKRLRKADNLSDETDNEGNGKWVYLNFGKLTVEMEVVSELSRRNLHYPLTLKVKKLSWRKSKITEKHST